MQPLRLVALGLCCSAWTLHAQEFDAPRLAPAEYRSHFAPNTGAAAESGSRDGWESYPLAEDAGYDPTLDPVTVHGESMLVRTSAPVRDGEFHLGFIRRLHMVAGDAASMQAWVRVPDAKGSTTVHVSIFRGKHEERHDAVIAGDQWQQLRFSLHASSDAITALAIEVELPHAVQGRQERVFLRDVSVKALATQRVALRDPEALWDPTRELYYLQRSLRPGDELHAVVDASPATAWTLASPDGTIQAHGTGSNIRHRFAANDTPGAWTLHIASASAEATALLLLRPAQPRGLAFDQPPVLTPELLQAIRTRRDKLRTTSHAELGNNIVRMDSQWVLPGLPSYFSILSQPPELAMLDAIDYRSTGDKAALEEARTVLASIARWPLWVHPWFPAHGYHSYYPVGIMTRYVMMAEQFLGDDLPQATRAQLGQSLMNLSIKPIYEEYVLEDRLQFNTSNWIGNTDGGALLAALASDDPNAAGYALGLYVKERDHVRAAYTRDGSYGEGISYQRYDLETTALAAAAVKRLLGQSFDDSLMPAERYQRYAAYAPDGVLDYGDSHVDLKPANVFAYLASLNRSDRLTDFYFKYRSETSAELLSRVLFEPSIHPVKQPVLSEPASLLFAQRGIAILRDSWSPDSTVIAVRAGLNFNHNHADQGSVFFARNGVLWLGEAGYADYYKDPSFPTFTSQAIGHNTLLVDHDPESQVLPGNAVFGNAPTMTHSLVGAQASLVQADLASAYAAKLTRYTRTLFFVADGPLVVIDQVQADTPHIFTQVWHPKQAAEASQKGFHLTNGDHSLTVQSFASAALSVKQKDSPMPLASYEKSEHEIVERPTQFELSTEKPATATTIVTVVQPDRREPVAASAWTQNEHVQTLTLERSGVELSRDTPAITAWWANGALALHMTHYTDRRTGGSMTASRPVDMQLIRNADGTAHLEVEAAEPADLRVQGFSLQGNAHSVHLTQGHTSLILRNESAR